RAVFGVMLEESLEVASIAGLPAIVFRCIEYLEKTKAEQEEGIFRLSGSSAVIKSLKDKFNSAGLLKSFLRDLPSSILTPRDLHMQFLSVMGTFLPSPIFANCPVLRCLNDHHSQTGRSPGRITERRILSRSCQSQITAFCGLTRTLSRCAESNVNR
ncbi:hypothetical protein BJV77DRAFT_958134, partial [Russula vinacea]